MNICETCHEVDRGNVTNQLCEPQQRTNQLINQQMDQCIGRSNNQPGLGIDASRPKRDTGEAQQCNSTTE